MFGKRSYVFVAMAAALTVPLAARAQAATAPVLLVKSVRSIDPVAKTAVFPLHRGSSHGTTVWYLLTDVSDSGVAAARGLTFAPLLAGVGATQTVSAAASGDWQFPAAPDFSPARVFTPGPGGFPPAKASPGATASAAYSPFVRVRGSQTVYNAPIVATGDGPFDVTHHTNTADRVLAIDTAHGTAAVLLADGFANGKKVLYISTEASDPGAATIERATYAPALGKTPASARLRIDVIVNGSNQGLAYAALSGKLSSDATADNSASLRTSRNILGGLPAATPTGGVYDPLWDVNVGAWTPAAVSAHQNVLLTSADDVQKNVDAKRLTGPGGKAFGPAGFAVNCPVIAILP
jgi:hypothetical protein